MANKTIELKEKEFDKIFLQKCEEIDKKIEDIWNKIITDEKRDNICSEPNDYQVKLDEVWVNVFKMYDDDESDAIFKFTDRKNDDFINSIQVSKEEPHIKYYLAKMADVEITNDDMLDPITDSEYEFGINISSKELINRKMNFFRTKAKFLEFSKEKGEEIFNKYYKLIEDKTNDNIKYIDEVIDEMNDIII